MTPDQTVDYTTLQRFVIRMERTILGPVESVQPTVVFVTVMILKLDRKHVYSFLCIDNLALAHREIL